jgi:hypothetical protein
MPVLNVEQSFINSSAPECHPGLLPLNVFPQSHESFPA